MIVIYQGFSEESTGAYQLLETHIQSYQTLKSTLFLWFREKAVGRRGKGGQQQCLVHLMPQRCLAQLPFVAQSVGQRSKADTKNRQDSLQDTLCAMAAHRRKDKAVSCLDTSLGRSPQLSHGTGLTAALMLGSAHRYSEALATKKYTHARRQCVTVERQRPKENTVL